MTTHTPGPWAVREHWADEGSFEVYPTRGGDPDFGKWSALAEIPEYGPDDAPEAEANAHLIAAAPDLLRTLQDIAAYYPNSWAADRANEVIAKATGETP